MREAFNPWLHLVFPVLSSLALLWVAWKSLDPLPAAPVRYAPIVAGLWLVFGLLTLWGLHRSGRQEWKTLSQQIFDDSEQVASTSPRVEMAAPTPAVGSVVDVQ
jgi:hypothetical protein